MATGPIGIVFPRMSVLIELSEANFVQHLTSRTRADAHTMEQPQARRLVDAELRGTQLLFCLTYLLAGGVD